MFNINKSITEEYVYNNGMNVGGYPISKLIDEYNETNKIIGGGDVLNDNFINYKRFENLVLPAGLISFTNNEFPLQIGGYQTSKSTSKSTIEGSIDPDVHYNLLERATMKKYVNKKQTLTNRFQKVSSRRTNRRKTNE
jgi:hypothetical protein